MSERLDQIEALVAENTQAIIEVRKIVESNSRAIEAWANETAQYRREAEERDRRLEVTLDRTSNLIADLANVVYTMANRQEDHENRINRLEQQDE